MIDLQTFDNSRYLLTNDNILMRGVKISTEFPAWIPMTASINDKRISIKVTNSFDILIQLHGMSRFLLFRI